MNPKGDVRFFAGFQILPLPCNRSEELGQIIALVSASVCHPLGASTFTGLLVPRAWGDVSPLVLRPASITWDA